MTHFRPGNGPAAPIACGVKVGAVTAVFADVTCAECRSPKGSADALADRRQRAREAGYDACAVSMPTESESAAIECAIETATRVRIDADVISAACIIGKTYSPGRSPREQVREIIEAAFRAAGFEVEQ